MDRSEPRRTSGSADGGDRERRAGDGAPEKSAAKEETLEPCAETDRGDGVGDPGFVYVVKWAMGDGAEIRVSVDRKWRREEERCQEVRSCGPSDAEEEPEDRGLSAVAIPVEDNTRPLMGRNGWIQKVTKNYC